jgi:leader peptidase (prepilin peptidase)/N-methyltransferase
LDVTHADGPLALFVTTSVGWGFAAVWGALWGSFFNVCVYRVGLYESVVHPRSRCPRCSKPIGALDNIPVLSWVFLGGKCRRCGLAISVRYPLVEALSAALAVAVWTRFVAGHDDDPVALLSRFFVYFAFVGTLLVLSGIDIDHKLLPDRVTMPAIPIFLVCALLLRDLPVFEIGGVTIPAGDSLLGAVLGYGLVAVTAELSFLFLGREGMGYGDAKLLAMIGALLGWRGALVTFFGGPFVGLLVLVPIMLLRKQRLFGLEVPYGPFLVAAALCYLFFGQLLPPPLTFMAS